MDTRTTSKAAQPKGKKKNQTKLYQWLSHLNQKSLPTATVGAHIPLPHYQELACVQYWNSLAFLELQTPLFRLVRIYFTLRQTLGRAA